METVNFSMTIKNIPKEFIDIYAVKTTEYAKRFDGIDTEMPLAFEFSFGSTSAMILHELISATLSAYMAGEVGKHRKKKQDI